MLRIVGLAVLFLLILGSTQLLAVWVLSGSKFEGIQQPDPTWASGTSAGKLGDRQTGPDAQINHEFFDEEEELGEASGLAIDGGLSMPGS